VNIPIIKKDIAQLLLLISISTLNYTNDVREAFYTPYIEDLGGFDFDDETESAPNSYDSYKTQDLNNFFDEDEITINPTNDSIEPKTNVEKNQDEKQKHKKRKKQNKKKKPQQSNLTELIEEQPQTPSITKKDLLMYEKTIKSLIFAFPDYKNYIKYVKTLNLLDPVIQKYCEHSPECQQLMLEILIIDAQQKKSLKVNDELEEKILQTMINLSPERTKDLTEEKVKDIRHFFDEAEKQIQQPGEMQTKIYLNLLKIIQIIKKECNF